MGSGLLEKFFRSTENPMNRHEYPMDAHLLIIFSRPRDKKKKFTVKKNAGKTSKLELYSPISPSC